MTTTDPGNEVEQVHHGELLATGTAMEQFREYVAGLPAESTEDIQERILRQVLNATTLEAVARAGSAVPATEVLDVPLRVLDIRPDESSFTEGMDFYLHIVATTRNGDEVTVSCGAQDVVVKLVKLHQLGLLPCMCTLWRSERQTRNGFYPIFARIEPDTGAF